MVAETKKKDKKADISNLTQKSRDFDETMEQLKKLRAELQLAMDSKMNKIGNIVHESVPFDNDEDNNKVVRTWGEPRKLEITGEKKGYLHHHQIMECLDIVEFE